MTVRAPRLLLALAAALALAACSHDDPSVRDKSGAVQRAGSWSVFDLRRGDCLKPAADAVGEVADIPVVPCAQPHTQEVFSTVKHPADAFPGVAALQQWADVHCASELQDALNLSTADGWFVSYLLPSFDSWNKQKDKTVTCVLVFPNEPSRTGSVVSQVATAATTTTAAAVASSGSPTTAAKG